MTALLRLIRGTSAHETVPFMDGPYMVELTVISPGILGFRGIDRTGKDEDVTSEGTIAPFVLALAFQSREVLNACRQQAWSKDAEFLESCLDELNSHSTG